MLQKLHDRSGSFFSWVIIILIVIVFALFGLSRFMGGGQQDNNVATVNGKSIAMEDAQQLYNQLRQRAKEEKVFQPTQAFQQQLRSMAMSQLVRTSALEQDAQSMGYAVSPAIQQSLIRSIPAFQDKGQFSEERFQTFLASNPYASHILKNLTTQTLINQLHIGLAASEFTLPYEASQGIALIAQKRNVNVVDIPVSLYAHAPVAVSDKQIKAYYNAHKAEFTVPEKVQLSYVELSVADIMKTINPTTEALQQYYQNNAARYHHPAQYRLGEIVLNLPTDKSSHAAVVKKARKIETELKSQSFAKLVKQYSQDTASRQNGGMLPWASEAEMGPNLKAAVKELKKVGDVSLPIQGNGKITIYKLIGYRKADNKTFAQVKDELSKAYKQQQAQTQFNNESEQLANVSYSQPSSLEPVAKALNVKIQTTPYFTRQGEKSGMLSNADVLASAFSHDVLVNRNNSDVINLPGGKQVVLRVKAVKPQSVKPLKNVEPQIKTALEKQAKQQKALKFAEGLQQKASKGASLQSLAQQHGLSYHALGYVDRKQKGIKPEVLQAAFASNDKIVVARIGTNELALVQVTGTKPGKFENDKEKQAFIEQYANGLGNLEYSLYAQAVVKAAKVKIKNKNWQ